MEKLSMKWVWGSDLAGWSGNWITEDQMIGDWKILIGWKVRKVSTAWEMIAIKIIFCFQIYIWRVFIVDSEIYVVIYVKVFVWGV